jgi:hypothetical protein
MSALAQAISVGQRRLWAGCCRIAFREAAVRVELSILTRCGLQGQLLDATALFLSVQTCASLDSPRRTRNFAVDRTLNRMP